jgi:hypothetical protein
MNIQRFEQRLKELKTQFEDGQKMLADLEAKQTNLKTTLLRISGAIQVLEELLVAEQSGSDAMLQPSQSMTVNSAQNEGRATVATQ